ncbi:YdeI family protein [Roseivirga sp. BDSF3-8]|uniref:YdeI/OmpD-associated family protein n=1 Tax=Roseivirga sp. BDSF3-8 TaxID=3241598 RepID=UPI0035319F2F
MNAKIDTYLTKGCGRCSLAGTAACKVTAHREALTELRKVVLASGLKEELKWSQPCYTYENKNILLISAFKEYAAVAFFKGSLLKDDRNLLKAPGENSQAVRQVRFTSGAEVTAISSILQDYINEAIGLEKQGKKVAFSKEPQPLPAELKTRFEEDSAFKAAFEALTPGRQRGYILHFSQPKQSKTLEGRIVKHRDRILEGKGMHDK